MDLYIFIKSWIGSSTHIIMNIQNIIYTNIYRFLQKETLRNSITKLGNGIKLINNSHTFLFTSIYIKMNK